MSKKSKGKGSAMKRKPVILILISIVALTALYIASLRGGRIETQYEVAEVARGDLENTVTCTGTLSAVGTVEIGTQVSGTIDEIFADFNDSVEKGSILAVLDTTLLKAAVLDAEAGLLSAQAQYDEAFAEYQRNLPLFDKGYISEQEFIPMRSAVKTREAMLRSAIASLERAEANLRYAVIRSPIKGTVIQRTVEPGQTVAASFSTPMLFVIAEDLSKMEIHVAVDEGDIGMIEEGLPVRFTVQAYPDETFYGTVQQIRLQPEIVQNVVTYTVLVDAPNDGGLLLPGMTATVDLVVEHREEVLVVPSSALRFTPTQEMVIEARRMMKERGAALPDSVRQRVGMGMGGVPGREGLSVPTLGGLLSDDSDRKVVWVLDDSGKATPRPVRTGATDGRQTEIVAARWLQEGMQIITGINEAENDDEEEDRGSSRAGPPRFRPF
jgi:HlyD family secretion protein